MIKANKPPFVITDSFQIFLCFRFFILSEMRQKLNIFINKIIEKSDNFIDSYFRDLHTLKTCLYIFIYSHIMWNCYMLKYDIVLLLIVILFMLYILKFVSQFIEDFGVSQNLMLFNFILIIINLLTCCLNVLRYLFQDFVIFIRKIFLNIVPTDYKVNEYSDIYMENFLAIISLTSFLSIVILVFTYYSSKIYFNEEKEDMSDKEQSKILLVRYNILYNLSIWYSLIFFLLVVCLKVNVSFIFKFLFAISFFLTLIFVINNFYVHIIYYRKNENTKKNI